MSSDDEFFDVSSEGETEGFAPNSKYAYKREDVDVDRGLAYADDEEAEAAVSQQAAIQSKIADEDYGFVSKKKPEAKKAGAKKGKEEPVVATKANGVGKKGAAPVAPATGKRKREEEDEKPAAGAARGTSGKVAALERVGGQTAGGDVNERQRVLQQQSPELVKLLQEYNVYTNAIQRSLQPLLDKVKAGVLPTERGLSFLEMKMHLMLSYCMQVMFYSLLKVEGQQVQDHAVIENLVAVRTYIQKLRPLEQKLQYNISRLLQQSPDGGAAYKEATAMEATMPVAKKSGDDDEEESEEEFFEGEEGEADEQAAGLSEESEDEDASEDGIESAKSPAKRRKVSRQIEKNRGLVAHRSKKQSTPRVRNRIRAEKLDRKAKQLVKGVKTSVAQNYGGEKRIAMGTTRSRKLS